VIGSSELLEKLDASPKALQGWIKEGLPHTGKGKSRRFDPDQVIQWLLANGKIVQKQRVAVTLAEAAQEIGVNKRTFAEWCKDPSFPGRPGTPGRRDGYFPLGDIEKWRAERFSDGSAMGTDDLSHLRASLLQVKLNREELEFLRESGAIIDAEAVEELLTSTIATAKSVLSQLADRIDSNLPNSLPPATKADIRAVVERQIQEAYDCLEQLNRDESDDSESLPDDAASAEESDSGGVET
jgi:phage terminase Nu1 subunit (DNA packaging protein)